MGNSAAALIIEDGKILLIKRGDDAPEYPGFWACPGGVIEKGEKPRHAVSREAKEEAGVVFIPEKVFKIRFVSGEKKYRFLGMYKGTPENQADEASDIGWFSYEEAIKLPLAFDYRDIIKELNKKGII